ncbi:MAG TPA: replication-associated recombination protein A [Nitrosomonas europaea]|uniref:replication-associated recombination protein A n=1 Tax=Nitrosomonas europaea TaxID=915 RepID=UPI0024935880|nr:replication-associated recombination protein A [Nitrosomonas europaea]HRN82101.1 replication-associated recombination protein A [Nitrosomonas europaea]HRO56096.1 replication-associated recombination protein A [Nitrosomonas europaea]HRQ08171.1 replication-associated recombination protein A [Nitrosomonas europaea]HUM73702.1 replication-associated recombination protein A [Nitrosomonas europaea]
MTDSHTIRNPAAPLAERLRPRTLDDVIGQSHLLGPGKPLRLAFESGKPHSMILWGPPGSGKTTLARLMAHAFDAEFIAISAVLSGVKDIREAIECAQISLQRTGRPTLLFVDEVHRFNKAQQDAFLPHVEQGLITFIGATTENPSFEVNGALLSRAQVYALKALTDQELHQLFERARSIAMLDLEFEDTAIELLIGFADGDARRLLNLLEQVQNAAKTEEIVKIDANYLSRVLARNVRRFDKGGDAFYDQISALHKSIRGSSPDAALYWLCRMLDGGADPRYIGRRLIRAATEDIGLADPRALTLALNACEVFERLGSPEGELALAQATLYLACAPKSNAAYVAYKQARAFIKEDISRPVPIHLRNAPTRLMREIGHGAAYRYAHDEPESYAAGENYFPDDMPDVQFYRPVAHGLEIRIGEKLAYLHTLDEKARKKKDLP